MAIRKHGKRGYAGLIFLLLPVYSIPAADITTYTLDIKNGRFYPEIINVPARTRFKIVITNRGPGPEEFESTELRKEKVLAPGVTRAVVFAPLKRGTYRFFGEFHPDTAQGRIVAE